MNVLLVEDNPADAFLFTEVFSRNEKGARIERVVDGYAALDYLFRRTPYISATRPDVILLDLNLPRISGYEVLQTVKGTDALASIPVAILTTSREVLDSDQCRALGADVAFTKPHGFKDYERTIQHILKWASSAIPESHAIHH